MKNIAIFVDSYNDLDHILPFIDYVLSNKKARIVLYKIKTSNLSNCEDHLRYLREEYDLIPAEYDQNFRRHYVVLMGLYWSFYNFANKAKQNPYLLPFLIFFSRLRPLAIYLTQQEVNRVQKYMDIDVIMMDFGKELGLFGRAFVKYAQDKSITTIGYLHGFGIYTNLNSLEKDRVLLGPIKSFILKLSKPVMKRSYFDRYVVGNEQRDTLYSSSHVANFDQKYLYKVLEVGVPRFTSEWIDKYRKNVIRSGKFIFGDRNKINVVLFMSHPQYNVLVKELMKTIKSLASCDDINFVYKPHTRNGLRRIDSKSLNGYDASKISSLELSTWADVGIVYGSSIAFQLLQDNVLLIMPKYIHLNTTIFEENNACILSNSLNDLMNIFKHSKDEIYQMVDQKNTSSLIRHYVYGNENYTSLMNNFYHSVVNFNK
jgi:hypothetical protein